MNQQLSPTPSELSDIVAAMTEKLNPSAPQTVYVVHGVDDFRPFLIGVYASLELAREALLEDLNLNGYPDLEAEVLRGETEVSTEDGTDWKIVAAVVQKS